MEDKLLASISDHFAQLNPEVEVATFIDNLL